MEETLSLALCGFMGAGKTTVGRKAAHLLGWRFVDMDELISTRAGLSVAEIFERFGEEHFRTLERQAAAELSETPRVVIATGGGVLLDPINVDVFRRNRCVVILLDVPLSIIKERLRGDGTRPLLNITDREAAMRRLYNERLPLYRAAADHAVDASCPPSQVADAIYRYMRERESFHNPL